MSEIDQPPDDSSAKEQARSNRIRDVFISPHDGTIAPNYDDWKEVVNGPETYAAIASELADNQCCIVGWTDRQSTHHDVLFTLSPKKFGSLQFGLRGQGDLFVSIMRRGAFAFEVARTVELHPSYVGEKFGDKDTATIRALTELINGVLGEIQKA